MIDIKKHRFSYSFFTSVKDNLPKFREGTLEEAFGLKHSTANVKSASPCISPAIYPENRTRAKKNVSEVSALIYDCDDLTIEEVNKIRSQLEKEGLAFIFYTSFKNQIFWEGEQHGYRFRIALFPERHLSTDEFRQYYSAVGSQILHNLYDSSCAEPSRIFLKPVCPKIGIQKSKISYQDGNLLTINYLNTLLNKEQGSETSKKVKSHSTTDKPRNLTELIEKKGGRNNAFISLAGTLLGKGLSSSEINTILHSVNAGLGKEALEDEEVTTISESIERYSNELIDFTESEIDHAKRFKKFLDNEIYFIPEIDRWSYWNGKYWEADKNGFLTRKYIELLEELEAQASMLDPAIRSNIESKIDKLKKNVKIKATKEILKDLNGISRPISEFERSAEFLNVKNGILNLKTGDLLSHNKSFLFSSIVDINFIPEATCPLWEKFLYEIFQGDLEMVSFLQRALGYSLTGLTVEQVLFFVLGPGENGKSVMGNLILDILKSISSQADFSTFLESKSDKIRNDLARLKDSRIVFASESAPDKFLDEGVIKQMTGGDTITARFLFKEYFEYKPKFKIWMIANQFPQIKQNDHAIWRRIIPIRIDYKVPKHKRDNNLLEKLLTEKEGILNWIVSGCIEWYRDGLNIPDSIKSDHALLREETDIIKTFIEERCRVQKDVKVQSSTIYQNFKSWCESNGYSPQTVFVFNKYLSDSGFKKRKERTGRLWHGITIR